VKVAVAGAGIGGLCLAQGLVRAGLEVTVYERDRALACGGQGYRLHIDAEPALRTCLPPDLYELCVATSGRPGTAVTVVSKSLRPLRRIETGSPPGPTPRPTSVNRQTFREILAARLGGVIEFGRACTGFEQDRDRVTVQFSDGSSAAADVLVGADGIGSPVRRRYLPHALVHDTGIVCLYGRTPLTAQTRPLLPAPVRDGFTAVRGGGIGMAVGLLDFREPPPRAARRIAPDVRLSPAEPYLMWAVTGAARRLAGRHGQLGGLFPADLHAADLHAADLHAADLHAADLHAAALHAVRRWHPDLVRLVELAAAGETSLISVRTAVPVAAWPASRVTLLGDAIHAMSPARGSGAGTALRDAALLAGELAAAARGEKALVHAIGDYERQMIDYGFAAVRASTAGLAGGPHADDTAPGISLPRPGGWFPRRGQAAARRATEGRRRAARPGTAR
jgi:2-polyprenyl-6-methoxyphenol hydroxylase-like FAD-dependent oxidoreductase